MRSRSRPWKALWYGLATVTGLAARGYFIPYRHAGEVPADGDSDPAIEALFQAAWPRRFRPHLARIEAHAGALARIAHRRPPDPRWDQDWFPTLDAAAAYALIRDRAPARILEIGAGHSTRFILRALGDGGIACRVTCIDPAPRADLRGLKIELLERPLQHVATAALPEIGPRDMVVVDSSHLALPGSDVDHLLRRIVPRMAPGALLHLHDIFLPDPYPADWAWRGYNEQVVVPALLHTGGFEPVFASWYVQSRHPDAAQSGVLGRLPRLGRPSSLWLRRNGECPV